MGNIPTRESELVRLAQEMAAGFTANIKTFPSPTVPITTLSALITNFITSRDASVAAHAAAKQASETKEKAFTDLNNAVVKLYNYLKIVCGDDDACMMKAGCKGRKKRTKKPMELPGQPLLLKILKQIGNTLSLIWGKPHKGGKVDSYKIQCREFAEGMDGIWTTIEASVDTKIELLNMPLGKKMEFRILAMNKAGSGEPSNSVTAIF